MEGKGGVAYNKKMGMGGRGPRRGERESKMAQKSEMNPIPTTEE